MSNCIPEQRVDASVYRAVTNQNTRIDLSRLSESDLQYATYGDKNTLLHLAAAGGNVNFLRELLGHSLFKPEMALAKNVGNNTALHVAAEGGHCEVVEILLANLAMKEVNTNLVNLTNELNQTALFKACEAGHLSTVKKLLEVEVDSSSLAQESSDGRTCLHVAVTSGDAACEAGHLPTLKKLLEVEVNSSTLAQESSEGRTCLHVAVTSGNTDLLKHLLQVVGQKQILFQSSKQNDNTVLHLAVLNNCVSMVQLLKSHPDLWYYLNDNKETPLCIAVRLGFLDIIKALIDCRPDCIQIRSLYGKNVLHLAAEHRHVRVVKYLTELKEGLSQLINQPDDGPPKDSEAEDSNRHADGGGMAKGKSKDSSSATEKDLGGDTPLHIAARYKNLDMVELLLRVPGVNKNAVNNKGLTPLDIARDNTEYHEPYKLIAKLTSYLPKYRPFLYNAPTVSETKHKKSLEILEKAYSDRRNTELVVAVLLATMAFSAVFQVPGGFRNEVERNVQPGSPSPSPSLALPLSEQEPPESPILIHYDSFKLFLIFDCVAFFLSLFVVLMWTVSTRLTTGDEMLFMCITAAVTCVAFAFVAYGFMAAVYAVLAHRADIMFALFILGSSILICLGGNLACFYIVAKFAVRRARFHCLCCVPHLADNIVEQVWIRAEKNGILDRARDFQDLCNDLLTGHLRCALFTGHKKTSNKHPAAPSRLTGHKKTSNKHPAAPSSLTGHKKTSNKPNPNPEAPSSAV